VSKIKIINDDAINIRNYLEPDSVDLVATDNPYGVFIMGAKWDVSLPDKKIWKACLETMKPGAFLLAMAATRTYHRLACDLEDVGFQIKDCIVWGYSSGMPHGKNISKEIDRKKGLERPVIGKRLHPTLKNKPNVKSRAYLVESLNSDENIESWNITAPACEESAMWEGWNTQLKPSWEPIVVAAKPLEGTYAENVMKYKIGGINIDECRIPFIDEDDMNAVASFEHFAGKNFGDSRFFSANTGGKKQVNIHPGGRYPANLMYFDELFPGQYDKFFMIPKPEGAEKKGLSHDTVKPYRLFHRLVRMFTPKPSDVKAPVVVLDPFAGSGTTGLACIDQDRDFIGFDIDKKTCDEARRRLQTVKKPLDLFAR